MRSVQNWQIYSEIGLVITSTCGGWRATLMDGGFFFGLKKCFRADCGDGGTTL